jgi:hypothetical protein
MNINYLIYGFVGLGVLLLLSNFVDASYILSKLFFRKKEVVVVTNDNQKHFLEIVGLWYQLKSRCDQFNLKVASEKLDDVFPLLNEVLDK